MDAFMKKIERLAEMASGQSVPVPLDATGVMARIRGLEFEDDRVLTLPFRFFAGGAAAAAAAAVAVTLLAATAWGEMSSPFIPVESLIDLTEVL